MQLHQFNSHKKDRPKTRIGRGGKRGTTSGRGQKGQKSRSGHRIRPAQRDLLLRLPKKRGFRNKPKLEKAIPVNLSDLKNFSGVVELESLKKAGLIKSVGVRKIKILAKGEINKPLVFKGLGISKSAKIKIEKAGGKIE